MAQRYDISGVGSASCDEGQRRGSVGRIASRGAQQFPGQGTEHQRGNRSGRDGAKAVVQTLHGWMSDFSLTVEDLAVSGDTVWTRNRGRGVNTGSVMGQAPTGRSVEVDVIDILRFEDGKVVEHWGIADQLGLMMQVGAMPGHDRPAG